MSILLRCCRCCGCSGGATDSEDDSGDTCERRPLLQQYNIQDQILDGSSGDSCDGPVFRPLPESPEITTASNPWHSFPVGDKKTFNSSTEDGGNLYQVHNNWWPGEVQGSSPRETSSEQDQWPKSEVVRGFCPREVQESGSEIVWENFQAHMEHEPFPEKVNTQKEDVPEVEIKPPTYVRRKYPDNIIPKKVFRNGIVTDSVQGELTFGIPTRDRVLEDGISLESFQILYSRAEPWAVPFPGGVEEGIYLDPDSHSVSLEHEILDRSGEISRSKPMQLRDLLSPREQGAVGISPSRILVRGELGFGKSTLCAKIASDWSRHIQTFASSFNDQESLVVLFNLRDLCPGEKIELTLLEFIRSHLVPGVESREDNAAAIIVASLKEKLLVLLDGFDEASVPSKEDIRQFLKLRIGGPPSVFKNARIIVTSRMNQDPEFLKIFGKHVKIVGLSEGERKSSSSKFFQKSNEKMAKFDEALAGLGPNILREMSTFIMFLLCRLHESLDLNHVGTLQQLMENVVERLCHISSHHSTSSDGNADQVLDKLGELFLSSENLIINRETLESTFKDNVEFVINCGLFRRPFQYAEPETEVFEPIHQSFVDFLCISHINKKWATLRSESSRVMFILEKVFTDPTSDKIHIRIIETEEYTVAIVIEFSKSNSTCSSITFELHPEREEDENCSTGNGKFVLGPDSKYLKEENDPSELKVFLTIGEGPVDSAQVLTELESLFPLMEGRNHLVHLISSLHLGPQVRLSYFPKLDRGSHDNSLTLSSELQFKGNEGLALRSVSLRGAECHADLLKVILNKHVIQGKLLGPTENAFFSVKSKDSVDLETKVSSLSRFCQVFSVVEETFSEFHLEDERVESVMKLFLRNLAENQSGPSVTVVEKNGEMFIFFHKEQVEYSYEILEESVDKEIRLNAEVQKIFERLKLGTWKEIIVRRKVS